MTAANWAEELEGLRSTSRGWIYFGDRLLETYSSTQQIVALSTAQSEYISIRKGAPHTLEVRSAMVEFGLTFNVRDYCGCSSCAQKAWAWRAQRGRPGNKDGRFEANDLAVDGNTPSTANGLEHMDGGGDCPRGCRGSKRLPCTDLEREEQMLDEWLWSWICVGLVIVILMVLSGRPLANPLDR